MSRDRLAQMKAERDRARGYGAPSSPPQQQYNEPANAGVQGYPPQQQAGADYGDAPVQGGGYGQPQAGAMYPVQGGYNAPQGQQGYGPGPQAGRGAVAPMQQQLNNEQPQMAGQGFTAAQMPTHRQGYEMQGMQGNGGSGLGPGSSMQAFFAEIENISQSLQQLRENITQINILHNTVLNSTTDEQRQANAQRALDGFTTETSRLTNSIKLRIKNLSELTDKMPNVPGNEGEKNTRRLQVAAQKKKFMDLIQEYREVERNSRDKYRNRMERQYKIVKPDATQEEIKYAMDTDQGSQVFASALTQSTRYADARNAYREVQERHEDIKKIAQTMTELQQLFNDMALLVEQQDTQIQTIEATANNVETTMEAGGKELDKGVVKARKARRKRWICFWILVICVIAIVLAVTLSILSNQHKL